MRQHEHTPLAKIQNWAGRPAQPLFDSLVVFENYPIDETAMRGGQLDAQGFQAASRTHYPLTLIVLPSGRDRPQVELKFSWDPTRLDSDGVGRLAQTYVDLLADLADAAPDLPVGLIGRAPTPAVAEALGPLPELLPVRLAARGMGVTARPALVSRGQSLSWADLWRRSGALAATLQTQGVTPDSRVALLLPRGIPFVIGLLAAWRAGAAYVPLDPAQPAERLAWQLADCGAGWLVAEGPVDWCPPNVAQLLPGEAAAATAVPAPVVLHPDQAAYVIYTSGSTGRPKGVVVSHGSLTAYVSSVLDQMPSGIASAALLSTVAADLGHTTLFGALWQGWTLHLLDDLEAFDGARLGAYLRQHAVDLLKLVPSHLGALLHTPDAASVLPRRCLVLGGEAIGGPLADQIRSLRPDLAVLNHYGPTETTVGVVTRQGLGVGLSPVPLGRALPHAQIHVLDPNGHALAAEVAGEIAIGGQGVARGYLARPGLTAERFVPDPYGRPGSRLYRSGDRGRCSADGELVFLGRLDAQVKIRGWRVEPGEVAEQIRALPSVTDAAVVVRDSGTGPRLVGYVTGDVDPEAVRAALARRLPDPMIPSAIMVLERLPVTPNGKLDRAALPEPTTASATVVAPRTDTERMLCAVWMELLALPAVGVTDDFFRIGGDSLIAMRVMVRLRQSFGPDLPLRLLFDHPVLEALATQLEATARLAADDIAELQDILEELAS
jgi:amino acid adenylation domain-containing protein